MRRWLTRGVTSVGAASLLSDAGHELTTSLLPSLITSMGAGAGILGLIEGLSDALMGTSKLVGGSLAADPKRRGRLASGGYLGTAVATSLIGACVAVWQVAVLRAFSWVSRGLRSPARDTVLMSLVPREAYGRAAAVERAGDNLGAVLGPLFASLLVGLVGIRASIGLSFIPGVLAAFAITIAVRESRNLRRNEDVEIVEPIRVRFGRVRAAGLLWVLLPTAMFELGNLATTLLILRATGVLTDSGLDATRAASMAVLVYAGHNAVAAGASLAAGRWIDRASARRVLAAAAATYVLAYALLGTATGVPALVAGFLLSGVGIGLGETSQTAWLASALPPALRADGFGVLGLVQAFGDLGATVVAGFLWAAFSAPVAFWYAAGWMALSLLTLMFTRIRGYAAVPDTVEWGR